MGLIAVLAVMMVLRPVAQSLANTLKEAPVMALGAGHAGMGAVGVDDLALADGSPAGKEAREEAALPAPR